MGLLQVLVYNAASKLDYQRSHSEQPAADSQNQGGNEASGDAKKDPLLSESNQEDITPISDGKKTVNLYNIFLKLPDSDLHNLCSLLGRDGYYSLSLTCFLYLLNVYLFVLLAFLYDH